MKIKMVPGFCDDCGKKYKIDVRIDNGQCHDCFIDQEFDAAFERAVEKAGIPPEQCAGPTWKSI